MIVVIKFGYMLETLRMLKYRKVIIFKRCRQSAGKTHKMRTLRDYTPNSPLLIGISEMI